MYAMKSNNTAHIRNAVLVGEASLRRRIISFICDVCDVKRDTDDTRILNATLYPDHLQKNTRQFMTALFNIGRIWLGAATILPPRHIHDLDDTNAQDQDNFSTFRPKCTRYNPPVLLDSMSPALRHTHRT